jgi:hypothetical protein
MRHYPNAMDFSLKPPTRFAPAERETVERIREEHDMLVSSEAANAVLAAVEERLAVVNENRQLVHANDTFLRFVGVAGLNDILGMRLGELLGCVHAIEDLSGCGTHPTCRTCGTVNSALRALAGRSCVAEVNLVVERAGREQALDFDLEATPLHLRGRLFALVRLDPIER